VRRDIVLVLEEKNLRRIIFLDILIRRLRSIYLRPTTMIRN